MHYCTKSEEKKNVLTLQRRRHTITNDTHWPYYS